AHGQRQASAGPVGARARARGRTPTNPSPARPLGWGGGGGRGAIFLISCTMLMSRTTAFGVSFFGRTLRQLPPSRPASTRHAGAGSGILGATTSTQACELLRKRRRRERSPATPHFPPSPATPGRRRGPAPAPQPG